MLAEIKKGTEEIHQMLSGKSSISRMILTIRMGLNCFEFVESQRQELYRWLGHTDPSSTHHQAQKDYEAGTGDWMLNSPEWADWLARKHRSLWIHGIPGAGKTVLMSHLVANIEKFCHEPRASKYTYLYYYCYFGRDQNEAIPLLKWLVHRLSREAKHIPKVLYDIYKDGGEPSLTATLEVVAQLLISFDSVYITIDAIDESKPREQLLDIIQTLITDQRFKNLQLVASSREYVDIERTMRKFCVSLSMDNHHVQQDIRHCIHSKIKSNPRFGKWPHNLLLKVEESIANGAKGM